MELIPAIDLMQGKVVRLTRGDPKSATIYSEDPVGVAHRWEAAGADALHLVDLDAALGINSGDQLAVIVQIVKAVKIPVQVGGGIRTVSKANEVLSTGVQKVVLGTMAFQNPLAFQEALHKFGTDRIVMALDYSEGKVMIKGWQEATTLEPIKALERLYNLGARQFLMTAISQDGTLAGPDFDMLTKAIQGVGAPTNASGGRGGDRLKSVLLADAEIYASGGIATIDDIRRLKRIGVKGFIVGKALYEGALTMEQLCQAVKEE